ncbi:MAG: BrnT family toxin [Moorellales bacterium]
MRIQGFRWDSENVAHIARHGVDPVEAEQAFINRPLFRKARLDRRVVLGRTDGGRYLFVVFEVRGGIARVITARDMTASERRYYRRERGE